jgi:hypothetical protein
MARGGVSGTRPGARELTPDQFPRLSELRPVLGDIDRDAEFEFGLDLIFTGLRTRL